MHHLRHPMRFLAHQPEFEEDDSRLLHVPSRKLLKGRQKSYPLSLSREKASDLQELIRPNKEFDFRHVLEVRRGLASQEVRRLERIVLFFFV